MTADFCFTTPFTENKVHRKLCWPVCTWGVIAIRECLCDSSHYHSDKQLSNMSAVWHFYCAQIWGFLIHRITGLVMLESPQAFIQPSLWLKAGQLWGQGRSSFELYPVRSWKLYWRKGPTPPVHFRIKRHVNISPCYIPTACFTRRSLITSLWIDQTFFFLKKYIKNPQNCRGWVKSAF